MVEHSNQQLSVIGEKLDVLLLTRENVVNFAVFATVILCKYISVRVRVCVAQISISIPNNEYKNIPILTGSAPLICYQCYQPSR